MDTTVYSASWNSTLVFPSCVVCPKTKCFEDFKNEACDVDIFQYTSTSVVKTPFKNAVIRFDPQVYKVQHEVADKFGPDTDGWKLVREITKLLSEKGQGLFVSNGVKKSENRFIQRDICCSRHKLYRNPSLKFFSLMELTKPTMKNILFLQ